MPLPATTELMYAELYDAVYSNEFALRCAISGTIAATLYVFFGALTHKIWPRSVDRNIFELTLHSDLVLGLISVLSGSPMLQVFGVAHEKWGISKMYMTVEEYGWGYWLLSIPLYFLLWDAVFYVTHLILHWQPVYAASHFRHHAFRPPVAWSGIAIDPIETVFSGILPYIVPLFILPFHIYTVYALNILLVGWATMLHSSCPWEGNWLFIGARDHNVHHARGKLNSNFGAIFKLWDRMFGTLDVEYLPKWILEERLKGGDGEKESAAPKKGKAAAADAAPKAPSSSSKKTTTPGKAGARSQSPAARSRAQRR